MHDNGLLHRRDRCVVRQSIGIGENRRLWYHPEQCTAGNSDIRYIIGQNNGEPVQFELAFRYASAFVRVGDIPHLPAPFPVF